MALCYLDATFGDDLWDLPIPFVRQLDRPVAELLLRAARGRIHSPLTSSCGRLFDAVAALLGIRHTVHHEGQAALELELAMEAEDPGHGSFPDRGDLIAVADDPPHHAQASPDTSPGPVCRSFTLDATPLIRALVDDIQARRPLARISRRFHQALVQSLAVAASRVADQTGLNQVVLSGGCFQNRYLVKELTAAIQQRGLFVFRHRLVPPGDGGLALGQILVAAAGAAAGAGDRPGLLTNCPARGGKSVPGKEDAAI